MKKFLTFAVVALMAVSANAQIVSSRSSMFENTRVPSNNYVRLYISYSQMDMKFSNLYSPWKGTRTLDGVSLCFLYGINLTRAIPLYLEIGAAAQYNTKLFDDNRYDFLAARVPLNVSYKFSINDHFSIAPYAGASLIVNWLADYKYGFDGNGEWFGVKSEYNAFDEGAKRVQAGFQFGCGINLKHFYTGVGYQKAITEYIDGFKDGGLNVSVGLNF